MSLLTRAESSRYTFTSLHADVMTFISGLSALGDNRLYITSFGESPEGRALPLLVLSATGVKSPEEARALGLPIVLIVSGIHSGEVEGKEGCLMLARDLLTRGNALGGDSLLETMTIVIAPLFNPDGNDRIDPGNRRLHLPKLEGQIGPDSGVGTRVNASKINLNRDYMRHEALEMRLMQTRVYQVWKPDLSIDNHATNGSVHRFSMTYDIPHTIESGRPEPILYMRERLLPPVTAALKKNHNLDASWYGNFSEDETALEKGDADPNAPVREGWMTYPHHPRFGSNYRGLTNRMDLLLECYSYISFEERVRTAYSFMLETLRYVAAHKTEIVDTVRTSQTPREKIAVRAKLEKFAAPIEILTRTPRTLEGKESSVSLPFFGRFVGTHVVTRPAAYLVPPRLAQALAGHGLTVEAATGSYEVSVPTVERIGREGGRQILEAADFGDVSVSWKTDTRAPSGHSLVRTEQPLGAIAVYLCEPESDDGAIENGFVPAPKLGEEIPVYRVTHL